MSKLKINARKTKNGDVYYSIASSVRDVCIIFLRVETPSPVSL